MSERWEPPANWTTIKTIDAHVAGEPLRIVTEGIPALLGKTILDKRRYAQKHIDKLRRALMWEPRGHPDMYGCILTEPVTPDGTVGVLFLHNAGFSTMCGHGIIGLTTVALEAGLIAAEGSSLVINIDTPAGRVEARARRDGRRVREVSFLNVPSFVYALDQTVSIPDIGRITYDVAFGGAFYAFCHAEEFGLALVPEELSQIIDLGRSIKKAVMDDLPISHPFEEELSFLYGTIFVGPPQDERHHSQNVCVFADGEVDRSPTGTGVSARAALHHARKELGVGESFTVESILGTCFTGRIVKTIRFGPHDAVVPEITGSAFITGRSEFLIDPQDPLKNGFFLR